MEIKTDTLEWRDAYKLLQGSVLPRPIAFVSSQDENGNANLAPFSFFTVISANPMMVCFSPMRRGTDGAKKDTLKNIESTKEFVINIVSEEFVQQMNDCATEFGSDVDEFEASGLNKVDSVAIKPSRVKESKVHLECVLDQVLHFGGEESGAGSLVIGKVVHVHVADDLYESGRINSEKLNPVGRLAGATYTLPLAKTFELQRK
ncbi:flavin reductase family protein [Mesobacillus selenatarsenatis]|uniref:Nitrilotriacetate monooxygenase component B n=1 Tax=Mesobacillus selenatarsenatis (strain DSM 18680 / JCM 14380 / FERM P-15431 / SF-1) TaxID=1321606 RepID=A0A0A8X6P8_MESS1|nr:flavin reductase family protein [Mesobacillus selenatarsenatis]GAM14904.1 nitrilotriacetate monooxygenase component B [Mesobacillus selenatarsenatis SF-1]